MRAESTHRAIMNSLSKNRVYELNILYATLDEIAADMPAAEWTAMTQKELFDLVAKRSRKKVNPSLIQREIERLEQFQLPRNVDDQHATWGA